MLLWAFLAAWAVGCAAEQAAVPVKPAVRPVAVNQVPVNPPVALPTVPQVAAVLASPAPAIPAMATPVPATPALATPAVATLVLATPMVATAGQWTLPANPSPVVMTPTAGPLVRVRLISGDRSLRVESGQAALLTVGGIDGARSMAAGKPVNIRRVGGGAGGGGGGGGGGAWDVGGNIITAPGGGAGLPGVLTLSPAAPVDGKFYPLEVEGTAYRGQIRLVPLAGGDGLQFDVVNDVGLEDYLLSVVSVELLSGFHPEAFAAQAVVARTYALYEVRTAGMNRHWDVWADTRSQVYGGIGLETPRATAAVKATRGVVIAYGPANQERIFKTYFAACCGGIGQSAADAFNDPALPPLDAKNAGSLCRASPSYRWSNFTVGKADLARRIKAWATRRGRPELQIESLRTLEVGSKNRLGRAVLFDVVDGRGQHVSISGEELRWAVNAGKNPSDKDLWSSLMLPVDTGDAIRFTGGAGMGHGVGMCQWCAQGMALRGDKHEAIVAWSYPGSILKKGYP